MHESAGTCLAVAAVSAFQDFVEEEKEARPGPVKDDFFEEDEEDFPRPSRDVSVSKKPDAKKRVLDDDDFDAMEEDDFKAASKTSKEDDDASFFDEVGDEGDDLSLGEVEEAPEEEPPPPPPRLKTPAIGTPKPAPKAVSPMLYILPAVAVLAGIGFYFSKGKESVPQRTPISSPVEKVPAAVPPPAFKKPEIDASISADYQELKKIELTDAQKIISLTDRNLLKKNVEGSHLTIDKLVLVLYKTEARYVVSQTYHYSDGSQWTVETHFAEPDSDAGDVSKAFDSVYAG